MKIFQKEALGSVLEIKMFNSNTLDTDIDECFLCIEKFEQKYSRFIQGNFLWKLNETGLAEIDREFISLITLAQTLYKSTDWYFDITLLPLLENAGYGIYSEKLPVSVWSNNIIIKKDTVILQNNIKIDFGALWKGYMLDVIFKKLSKKYSNFILNFWGDIKISWTHTIWLEDPQRIGTLLWEIEVNDIAFAASSWEKRKFWNFHHIINPKTWTSQNDTIAVYTTHKLWVIADIYSTALFVCPFDIASRLIQKTPGLEALIISKEGTMFCSPGFQENLTIYKNKI